MARRGRKALQARKARWDRADLPEKKGKPVRLDLPGLRDPLAPLDLLDLLDLLDQQARRERLGRLERAET